MTGWTGVRERVLALGFVSNSGKVFGANYHNFDLDATLSTSGVDEIESWLGVRLPEDCRDFLITVGAGGASPAYGVFPLRRSERGWRWQGDGADITDASLMAVPFPEPVRPTVLEALHTRRPNEEDFEDIDDFDPVFEAWTEELEATL